VTPERFDSLGSGLRHDFRNLLACLALDVEQLSRSAIGRCECGCRQTSLTAAARAMRSVERIGALLLDEPSPASAMMDPSIPAPDQTGEVVIAVRETLMEVLEALAPAIPRGTRITLSIAPDIVVGANPVDVFRIFLNILLNAIDVAIRSEGTFHVRISGRMADGRTSIAISDNGPGLPAAVRDFFDLPAKAPQDRPGRGQGLRIARHLAKINGGAVSIASTGALGTTLEIVFPSEPKAWTIASPLPVTRNSLCRRATRSR
jgi:signal transduction histidine kinase